MTNTSINIVRFLLLLLLPVGLLTAAAPRVAILSDADNAVLADQLTAALSSEKEVELVERSEIDKIISERKFSGNGLEDNLTIGKLLRADGLLVLEGARVEEKSLLKARLVATAPGIVIASGIFNGDSPEITAAVASRFQPLWQKLAVARKDAVPISMLNLRCQIRGSETLESQLTFMLTHQLVQQREVFVLERWRMDDLLLEKNLTEHTDDFWTGSYVVDGEIEALSGDQLKVIVRLRPPGGQTQEKLEVVGTRADLPTLVNKLAVDLIQKLPHTTTLAKWSADLESKQFFNEARWAFSTGLFPEARSAAEASWALGNRDAALSILHVRIHSSLAFPQSEKYDDYSINGFHRSVIDATSMSGRINSALTALTMAEELIPDGATEIKAEIMSCCTSAVLSGSRVLRKHRDLSGATDTEAIEELRAVTRAVAEKVFPLNTPNEPRDKRLFYITMAVYVPFWHETPAEAVNAWRRLLSKRFADDHWQAVTFSGVRKQLLDRRKNFNKEASNMPWLIGWHGESQSDLDGIWEQFVKTLETSEDIRETIDGSLLRFAETNTSELPIAKRKTSQEEIRMCERMWEARDYLLSQDLAHGYFSALRYPPVTSYLDDKYMRRWLEHYLRNTESYKWNLMFILWQGANLDRESAEHIYPFFKEYRARLPEAEEDAAKRENDLLQRFPGLDGSSVTPALPLVDDSLVVTQSWFPPELTELKRGERILRYGLTSGGAQAGRPVLTKKHIWLPISFDNRVSHTDGLNNIILSHRIYKLDRLTFKPLEFFDSPPVSEKLVRPPSGIFTLGSGAIHVNGESLFLEIRQGIQQMDLKTGGWRTLQLPQRIYDSVLAIDDDIFVGFSPNNNNGESGILHYTAASDRYHVLASNRRQPTTDPLKGDKASVEALFEVAPGQLGTVIWKSTDHKPYVYDKRLSKWEALLPEGAELSVWRGNRTAVLHSKESGVAIARDGKPLLTLFGSDFTPSGKPSSPPQIPAKADLPKREYHEQMVYGDGKLWVALYRDHPTLGTQAVLKAYTADGNYKDIFVRFELPPEVIAASGPINRSPKPIKLDEKCVRIKWMSADEGGLTFFTGNAGDRAFASGVWFLPMSKIDAWLAKRPQE